jgi:hypothetical protein
MTQNEESPQEKADEPFISRTDAMLLKLIVVSAVGSLFVGTAAAQSNPICAEGEATVIGEFVNAVILLATYGGIMGTAVTYFGTNAIESMPVSEERRQQLKDVRKKSFSASLKLVIGGPLIYILLDQSGLSIGECVSLIPF